MIVHSDFGSSPIEDYTLEHNFFSGGAYTIYFDEKHGIIPTNIRLSNNVWERNSYAYGPTEINANGPSQCVEWTNNTWDTGGAVSGPQNAQPLGGCGSSITPIPSWAVSTPSLSSSSCTAGNSACNGIDIQNATASGSQTGGSPRWRFNCGGSPSSTGGLHPQGADLWYDYPACNGQTSCTMSNVCDYGKESTGNYTVRIYSESGPGSGVRVSAFAKSTFTVN
jgi:hypothetical protein